MSILYLYVLAAGLMRVLPHPWNLTPVGAMFLFSAATFRSKWQGWLAPLAALMISDYAVSRIVWPGTSWFNPYMWIAFSLVGMLGWTLRSKITATRVAGVAVTGSVAFWTLSNFAIWAAGQLYPHTLAGLTTCYVAAIPFFRNDVLGNLAYCGVMFGSYAYIQHRQAQLARA